MVWRWSDAILIGSTVAENTAITRGTKSKQILLRSLFCALILFAIVELSLTRPTINVPVKQKLMYGVFSV